MSNKYSKHGTVLRRTALAVALGVVCTGAFAQSRSAGAVFGNATAGSTITIVSTDTGLTRTIKVDNSGRYRASELPLGNYSVTSTDAQGNVVGAPHNVRVGAGGTEVDFTIAAKELSSITVSANALPAIDVSQTGTTTDMSAEILNNIPVSHDITQAAILAPGVIPADSRYGNAVSFGGSAASENAYYINGYPVTNSLTNIGSTTLPFDAIQSEQVITGGYSARYGRSTGGVINILTKSGTNTWKGGALVTWQPESLRANRHSSYYAKDNQAPNAGQIYQDRSQYSDTKLTYGAYVSGPLIRDRLFLYATAQWEQEDYDYNGVVSADPDTGRYADDISSPRWLVKLDWNINDSNLLEFTGISDKTETDRSRYSFDYSTLKHGTEKNGGYRYKDGGETYIGKYTSYLTDSLTLSAMYGTSKILHYSQPLGYDPSLVYVGDNRPISNKVSSNQPYLTLDDPEAYDKTDGYRVDLEWRVGDHDLSFGYDVSNAKSQAGTTTSGPGYAWFYAHTKLGDIPSSGGLTTTPNSDYVYRYVVGSGGSFKVEQKAFYVEDRWQVSDNWLLSLGMRNDGFKNYNADGVVYVEQKNQWAPRLGFSWDVFGDSSLKVFGNAGRYFLAMPANVALRGAAGSTLTSEFFTIDGISADGMPINPQPIGDGPYSSNNEYGQAPDPRTVAAKNLKSHYQDEFILGMQQSINEGWVWGARVQYRDLKSAIDDQCDNRPMLKYMEENGIAVDPGYNYSPDCRLFNPGENNVMLLDIPDAAGSTDLVAVPYNAKDMGMYLKRKYIGLDLSLEHPFDGKWFARVEYTLSHSFGNDEGQLNSDIAQGDVSQTTLFDHKELMSYGGGNLPNDRRHVLKAYGFYQLAPEWQVGGTLVAKTGRPRNCLGYVPTDSADHSTFWADNLDYGRYYHYCGGEPSPRGSVGRTPTDFQLSLNASYTPHWAGDKLKLSVDVFNVLNRQVAQNYEERGENGGQGVVDDDRFRVISYSSPRAVRFTARYDF